MESVSQPPSSSSLFDRAIVILSLFILAISWVGMCLVEVGRFSAAGVLGGTVIVLACVAALWRGGRTAIEEAALPAATRPDGATEPAGSNSVYRAIIYGVGVAIFVVTAFLYFRPAEAIFGNDDAGLHLNAGAHIATAGKISIDNPDLPIIASTGAVDAPLELYDTEPFQGRLLPQFSGVFEAWEAMAFDTLDLPGSLLHGYQRAPAVFPERPLYLSPTFGLLALIIWFGALRLAFGRVIALAASAGLALSYPEMYFARLTMAEILTQLFCVIALYGFVRCGERSKVRYGAFAGAGVGLAFLTHIDAGLLFVPIVFWLVWLVSRRQFRRCHGAFSGIAGVLFVQGCWHYLTFEPPYVETNVMPFVDRLNAIPLSIRLAVTAGIIITGVVWIWWPGRVDAILSRPSIRRGLAGGFGFIAVLSYLVRPVLQPAVVVEGGNGPTLLAGSAGLNSVLLGEYIGPFTLACAVTGIVLAIARSPSRAESSLLWVGGIYLVIFDFNAFVAPYQPFWARRFVPEVFPMLMAFAIIGLCEVSRSFHAPILRQSVRAIGFVVLGVGVLHASFPLWTLGPLYQGGLPELTSFAYRLPSAGVVIVDRKAATHWLPLPLTFLFLQDTYVLVDRPFDQQLLVDAVKTYLSQGKTVTLIAEGGTQDLDPKLWSIQPLTDQRFQFPEFPVEYLRPPSSYRQVDFHVAAYNVRPLDQTGNSSLPGMIELGRFDFPSLVGGFYPPDYGGDTSFRFTNASAALDLPRPSSSRARVRLRLGGQRPVGAPPALLRLTIDGASIGNISFPVGDDPNLAVDTYSFEVPITRSDSASSIRLGFDVNTWKPGDYGRGDQRDLGVAVFTVQIESLP